MAARKIARDRNLKRILKSWGKPSWSSAAGIGLLVMALVIMQSSEAVAGPPRAPQGGNQSNWSTVLKVGIGGSTALTGVGLLFCAAMNVGCVPAAIAGGIATAIGVTIGMQPEPPAPPPLIYGPTGMPDAPEVGVGGGKGGNNTASTVFDEMPDGQFQKPTPGKVKVLMAPPGRSNSFAIAAKKIARSFDWRQSAFDTASSALINKQRSGLFVGAPAVSSRVIPNRAPGPVHIELPPSHHPLIRPH